MRKNLFFLLLLSIIPFAQLVAQSSTPKPEYQDGPYIFMEDSKLVAKWLEKNALQTKTLEFEEGTPLSLSPFQEFTLSAEDLKHLPEKPKKVHFETEAKVAALSDVHGQYDVTIKLLQANKIIDEENNWIWGDGHLVIVGDVFDRGDQVTEILWLLHKLERQAPKQGGQVHLLLGNHEIMVLTGDLRYLHKKYRYTMAVFGVPLDSILSASSYLGAWLRSKPLAISINDMAFVHGGFSELLLSHLPNLEAMNTVGWEAIDADPKIQKENPLLDFVLHDQMGPMWYRGYFDDEVTTKKNANAILRTLKKDHLIVGHTSHLAITPLFDNRIIGVDSSIKFGKSGEILIREGDDFFRGTFSGEKIKL